MIRKKIVNHFRKLQNNENAGGVFMRPLLNTYRVYKSLKHKLKSSGNTRVSRWYLQSRNLKRNLAGENFKFITLDQAMVWTSDWIKTFPDKYDLVIGVPRSGLLIAGIISLKLGKPLTTPDQFVKDEYWMSSAVDHKWINGQARHILLVDDSIDSGKSLAQAMKIINTAKQNIQITTAVLITKEDVHSLVNLYHKVVPHPRFFEWNILHRKVASYWGQGLLAVDMDGVLCENCPEGIDDNEKLYVDWLKNAKPYLIPAFEIDAIISSRLEKYRKLTEDWLKKFDVKYKRLYLWKIPCKSQRYGNFANYKIKMLLKIKPDIFWESNWQQSQRIWKSTQIPTLCIDELTFLS